MSTPLRLAVLATVFAALSACNIADEPPSVGGNNDIVTETCGNGAVEDSETCDDGNVISGDGCSTTCQTEGGGEAVCGDGTVEAGEECDDGNTTNGDGCSAQCDDEGGIAPTCGDGALDDDEECDDSNTDDGDGCSALCVTEFCGDAEVNNGEECDGGAGCTEGCEIDPGPVVVSVTPAPDTTGVPIQTPVTVTFSEDIDPDSVRLATMQVGAEGWVAGTRYGESGSMPGVWEVNGNVATFVPGGRGVLQEFETTYHIIVTTEVADLQGNRVDEAYISKFETLRFDPAMRYSIYNAQFNERLATFDAFDPTGNPYNEARLTDRFPSSSYWRLTSIPNDYYTLRNEAGGSDLYLEGGDGSRPAGLTPGGGFTGQHYRPIPKVERMAEAGVAESPNHYHMTTAFQGTGRGLGVLYTTGTFLVVGTQDATSLDHLWYFKNEGPR